MARKSATRQGWTASRMSRAPRRFMGVWFITAVVALVAAAALLWLAFGLLRPFPPFRVVMATGAAGSDYAEVAGCYRAILARSNIALVLIPTAGALENLARLRDPHSEVQAKLSGSGTNPTH